MAVEFDKQRFEALVLYVAHRRRDDERFGRTKLAKALFYSDFAVYQDTGKALTGATYVREPNGPFPRELKATEQALEKRGLVYLDHTDETFVEKRIIPRKGLPANLTALFEGWQIILVNDFTDRVASARSAKEISDLSHKHPGWRLAGEQGVVIPYETSVLPQEPPTAAEAERAKEVARERGWLSSDGEWQWERSAN